MTYYQYFLLALTVLAHRLMVTQECFAMFVDYDSCR